MIRGKFDCKIVIQILSEYTHTHTEINNTTSIYMIEC